MNDVLQLFAFSLNMHIVITVCAVATDSNSNSEYLSYTSAHKIFHSFHYEILKRNQNHNHR